MTQKPAQPLTTLKEVGATVAGRGQLIRASLEASAKQSHGITAEASHLAALAAERLQRAAKGQGIGLSELPTADLEAVLMMLRAAQNAAHVGYLRQHGSEADYQSIGKKVAARYRTPAGKWRLLQP